MPPPLPVLQDGCTHRSGQDVTGIDRGHPEHPITEQFTGKALSLLRAGQAVDHGRVSVDYVGLGKEIVQGSFHTGSFFFLAAVPGRQEIRQDPGLPGVRVARIASLPHSGQPVPAHPDESLFADLRQGDARGLHEKVVPGFEGGVAPAGQQEFRVSSVKTGNADQLF